MSDTVDEGCDVDPWPEIQAGCPSRCRHDEPVDSRSVSDDARPEVEGDEAWSDLDPEEFEPVWYSGKGYPGKMPAAIQELLEMSGGGEHSRSPREVVKSFEARS